MILKGGGPEGPLVLSFNLALPLGLRLREAEEESTGTQPHWFCISPVSPRVRRDVQDEFLGSEK